MPITFSRLSPKCQTLIAAIYISFIKFKVENSALLCSQRTGKRSGFVLFFYKGTFLDLNFFYWRVCEIMDCIIRWVFEVLLSINSWVGCPSLLLTVKPKS